MQLYKSGNMATDTPSDVFTLWGWTSAGNKYFTFFNTATNAPYQVTSGKTFRMTKMWWVNSTTSSDTGISLGTGTASAGQNSAASPAGWSVVFGGVHTTIKSGFMIYEYTSGATNRPPISPQIDMMLAFPSATPGYYISAFCGGEAKFVYAEGFEL